MLHGRVHSRGLGGKAIAVPGPFLNPKPLNSKILDLSSFQCLLEAGFRLRISDEFAPVVYAAVRPASLGTQNSF